jgi:hypothetical protein
MHFLFALLLVMYFIMIFYFLNVEFVVMSQMSF